MRALKSRPIATLTVPVAIEEQPESVTDAVEEAAASEPIASAHLAAGVEAAFAAPGRAPQAMARRAPRGLRPMYLSLAALEAADYHSTHRALAAGGREANPIAARLVHNDAALVAAKAAVTLGVIVAAEKMWPRHRVGAVVFVGALNVGMAAVVAHNYRVR